MYDQVWKTPYDVLNGELTTYKNKSRIYRGIKFIGDSLLWIFLFQILLVMAFQIQAYSYPDPTHLLNYYFTIVFGIVFFTAPIFWFVGRFFLSRIKKDCNYNEIKMEFIYIYDALTTYEKYIHIKSIVHKKDTLKQINNLYKLIDNWDTNLPILKKNEKDLLLFIKNDFKHILIKRIKSDTNDDRENVQSYLFNFGSSILTGDWTPLNSIYTITEKDRNIKYSNLTEVKMIMNGFVKQNKALSQIIFSAIFTSLIYGVGNHWELTQSAMATLLFGAFSSSFFIFKWIQSDVLEVNN